VPTGQRVVDPAGTWDHPTWRRLDFSQTDPHGFAFEFESQLGKDRSTFVVRAHGDLDGDGVTSTFEITGESAGNDAPKVGPLRVHREVE
jgi:type IV pilus assembly protein PilA